MLAERRPRVEDGRVAELVTVRFELTPDEVGWPPAASEGLWAEPLGRGRYRLDNTPFYVRGVAADDVVRARRRKGQLWVREVVAHSGRLTLRIIVAADGPLGGDLDAATAVLLPLGVRVEGDPSFRLLALDVGVGTPLAPVKDLLRRGEENGSWYLEEGCVSDAWRAL